jgi:hypothetical protein
VLHTFVQKVRAQRINLFSGNTYSPTQTHSHPRTPPSLLTHQFISIFFLSATEKAIFSLTLSISTYFTFAIDKHLWPNIFFTSAVEPLSIAAQLFFSSAAETLVNCCIFFFLQCSGDSSLLLHNYFLPVQRGLLFITAQLFFTSAPGTLVYCCTIIF